MSDNRQGTGFNHPLDQDTIPTLLRNLADQGSHLAQQQANLIKAEVNDSVSGLKLAVGAMAGAAIVGIAGLGVLLMALAYLLAEAVDLWLATLIVAAVTLLAAYVLFRSGQKKIENSALSVDRTKRTLERAPTAVSGHSNEGVSHERF